MAKKKLAFELKRSGAGEQGAAKALVAATEAAEASQKPAPVVTKKMTISMPTDLLEELRVMATELPPKQMPSISGFIVQTVRAAVEQARNDLNDGQPFESDEPVKPRTGRRPGI